MANQLSIFRWQARIGVPAFFSLRGVLQTGFYLPAIIHERTIIFEKSILREIPKSKKHVKSISKAESV
ncbi:MAG: hypothetical protein EBT92_14200 [Planctomycetes bacterium]|nr:hypothetical protein [Planctomycetota bacterium]